MMYAMNRIRTINKGTFSKKVSYVFEKKQTLTIIILLGLCIMILSFGFISTKVRAEKAISTDKLVTSIKIEKGDSLWSIASEYITEEYSDINTYIKEIKKSNQLTSDTIHEGRYIIVPYYVSSR